MRETIERRELMRETTRLRRPDHALNKRNFLNVYANEPHLAI